MPHPDDPALIRRALRLWESDPRSPQFFPVTPDRSEVMYRDGPFFPNLPLWVRLNDSFGEFVVGYRYDRDTDELCFRHHV